MASATLYLYNSGNNNAPATSAQLLTDNGNIHIEHKTRNGYYLYAAGLDANSVHAVGWDKNGKKWGEWDLTPEQLAGVLNATRAWWGTGADETLLALVRHIERTAH